MTNVLLLSPPVSFTNEAANSGIENFHIGLGYLHSSLKNNNISVKTINNADAHLGMKDIISLIEHEKIKIVGISTLLSTVRSTVEIAKQIKEKISDKVHICIGNSYVSTDTDLINRYPYFDSAIIGEADHFIVEHCTRILQGEKVEGVFTAETPMDLDDIAFPDLLSIEGTLFKDKGIIPLVGTRGCPFLCGYCARQALSKKVRVRTGENIAQEIRRYLGHTNNFFFQDDTATLDKKHLMDLAHTLIKYKIKINYSLITRLDQIDTELLILLKRSGCQTLLVGVESRNDYIRNTIIKKNLPYKAIITGLEMIKKAGLNVQLFFMLGHPEETDEQMLESVAFPVELLKMGFTNIEQVGFHLTLPIPGTRYFDWCVEHSIVKKTIVDDYIDGKLGDGYFGYWPYLVPKGTTLERMIELRSLAHKKFYFHPRYIASHAVRLLKDPKQIPFTLKNAVALFTHGASSDRSKREN